MRQEVRAMCTALGTPTLLITHDPDDVAEFGGTVVLYDEGRVQRVVAFADGPKGGFGARELVLGERFAAYS
jgi:molybdate transport system ATP-binding protein